MVAGRSVLSSLAMERPVAIKQPHDADDGKAGTLEGSISVVMPALNAAASLPSTIEALRDGALEGQLGELLVVDGGSRDDSQQVAQAAAARVLTAPKGRGRQLAAGAEEARGDWLLFLHADTSLSPAWGRVARDFMAATGASGERAAAFRFALDDAEPPARRIERLARWRGRALGLPYGDQGLLIPRAFYRRLGGYRPLDLMEDVEMVRRIGRRRLTILQADAVTSAARYRRDGWIRRPLRNLSLLFLYYMGVPSHRLSRLYQ